MRKCVPSFSSLSYTAGLQQEDNTREGWIGHDLRRRMMADQGTTKYGRKNINFIQMRYKKCHSINFIVCNKHRIKSIFKKMKSFVTFELGLLAAKPTSGAHCSVSCPSAKQGHACGCFFKECEPRFESGASSKPKPQVKGETSSQVSLKEAALPQSTEVAFLLLNQQPWVRLSVFPPKLFQSC